MVCPEEEVYPETLASMRITDRKETRDCMAMIVGRFYILLTVAHQCFVSYSLRVKSTKNWQKKN